MRIPGPSYAYRQVSANLDNVLGGGLVPGSTVLMGGDPGIGKSTLLLQAAAALAAQHKVMYISGEEAENQLRLRAARLEVAEADISLLSTADMGVITANLDSETPPAVVIIDSIQTMFSTGLESAPGTVGQVRTSAQILIQIARKRSITCILVGHVTREGTIAGPKVLEHMVDVVLHFEGERGNPFRLLRGMKNRFGATDEIGVFDMTVSGLRQVDNPSKLFLSERGHESPGAAVFAGMEGSRPILVEIQALVNTSYLPMPRRAVVGWDQQRLAMILAVLEARAKLKFSHRDVYLNVVGGMRISEPAADLAVAVALVSALLDRAVDGQLVMFGEIGLSGEVRRVAQSNQRVKEAKKLGFTKILAPEGNKASESAGATSDANLSSDDGIAIATISRISDIVEKLW